MKLDIFNINDFITANHCPEVTNPVFWGYDKNPTPDGLFSYELFGFTDEDRKNIFGYIDLKGNYIHPLIYLMMNTKMGALGKILQGQKYAVIANRKITVVPDDTPNAETGVKFIYDHFEEINWIDLIEEEEMDSIDKKTRLKFLKSLKKDEFFVNKWLVLPPFYRAESSTDASMGDSINKLYKELISKVRGSSLGFSFDIFGDETKLRIQNILKDLYLCTLAPLSGKNMMFEKGKTEGTLAGSGKNSMVRRHLLGKAVDWSSSSVITSPHNSAANTPGKKPVPWGYGAFPLASLLAMFQPFFVAQGHDFLEQLISFFSVVHANEIKRIDVGQFNSDAVEKIVTRFIKDINSRFDPITIKYTGINGQKMESTLQLYEYRTKADYQAHRNYILRPMTVTDMLYMIALDVLKDKHVYVTRFPIANFQNIYPSKIKVLSTARVRPAYITFTNDDIGMAPFFSDEYPIVPINGKETTDSKFYDVMLCGNAYLDSLGGDYDGDMLYMRAVFTQEANEEADRMIYAKTNMLNANGTLSRGISKIGKDCIMGLYELTKDVD